MSFLAKKNKSLYGQKNAPVSTAESRKKREDFYVQEKDSRQGEAFLQEKTGHWWSLVPIFGRKKIFLWGQATLFGLLFVLGGIFLFIRYQETSFSESRLSVSTNCLGKIESGSELNCQITVENDNRLALEETILRLSYSNELELLENDLGIIDQDLKFNQVILGDFPARQKKTFNLKFKVFGAGGAQIFLENAFRYKLSNFGVTMEKKSQFSGFVETSPLALFLISSGEAAEEEVLEFRAIVKNESATTFSDLLLRADYPEGFVFLESDAADLMLGDNYWQIKDLGAGEQKVISFKGKLGGNTATTRTVTVLLGKKKNEEFVRQAEASKSIKLVNSRIQLEHYINNNKNLTVANDGQVLDFKIVFKNNSDRPLRDLILKERLEGLFIEDKKLNLLGEGFYDSQNKEIIWKASDTKSLGILEPGQTGEVRFLVYLKNNLAINNLSEANQQVFYQSEIESLDINSPLGENKKVVSAQKSFKINSRASLELSGSREDPAFISFGSLPMEEGVETSVVLKLRIKNSFNDLKNATVRLAFPSRVSWKNAYNKSSGELVFNERSNELVWKLDQVKAGVGYYLAENYLYFQIGVTPSKNDSLKDLIKLVNTWSLTAEDVFTGQKIENYFSDFTFGRLDGV